MKNGMKMGKKGNSRTVQGCSDLKESKKINLNGIRGIPIHLFNPSFCPLQIDNVGKVVITMPGIKPQAFIQTIFPSLFRMDKG